MANPEYEVDIFAHFWIGNNEEYKKEKFLAAAKPVIAVFEEQKDFSYHTLVPDPRFFHDIYKSISMFYGMEQVNNLRIRHEKEKQIKYDYVVRLRSDIFFSKPIGNIEQYDQRMLHVFHSPIHLSYGIRDYFAIASPEFMNNFTSVYSNMHELVNRGAAVLAEFLLGYNALKIYRMPVQYHEWEIYKWEYMLWHLHQNYNPEQQIL